MNVLGLNTESLRSMGSVVHNRLASGTQPLIDTVNHALGLHTETRVNPHLGYNPSDAATMPSNPQMRQAFANLATPSPANIEHIRNYVTGYSARTSASGKLAGVVYRVVEAVKGLFGFPTDYSRAISQVDQFVSTRYSFTLNGLSNEQYRQNKAGLNKQILAETLQHVSRSHQS